MKHTANETSLSESLSENMSEGIGTHAEKARYFRVMDGGRTWARTKDPLIKSQQIIPCFQQLFRHILRLSRNAHRRQVRFCRKAQKVSCWAHEQLIFAAVRAAA
jgi:hypothetical protein